MNARAQDAVIALSRAEIREALRKVRETSSRMSREDGWYGIDRGSVSDYFRQERWKKEVGKFIGRLKTADEPVLYVDMCGRAVGKSWGADETYTFSLQPLTCLWSFERSSDTHVRGDLFSTRDFRSFLRSLPEQPALITFHPVAGLQGYLPVVNAHETIVYGMLEGRLRNLIDVLKPGGFIHLGKPFSLMSMDLRDFFGHVPIEQWESHLRLKNLCREMRCSIEQGFEGDYHCHLIRKWRVPNRAR